MAWLLSREVPLLDDDDDEADAQPCVAAYSQ